jgi:hypothetical protein
MIGRALAALSCIALLAGAARAQNVDLALVLAVDSSGSIDSREFALQRMGYARALVHADVLSAIARGPHRAIAVAFVEWSGPEISTEVVPWTRITDAASAAAVAARLAAAPRTIFGGGTALGGAIDHGMALLARNPFPGLRRVIDISGDGPNNRGRWPDRARDEAVARGVTINGLAIEDFGLGLVEHFRDEVIGGPGAFVTSADGFDDFARAVLKKLKRELNLAAVAKTTRSIRSTPNMPGSGCRSGCASAGR